MYNNVMLMNKSSVELADLSWWAMRTYSSTYTTMTSIPSSGYTYLKSVMGTDMHQMFSGCSNLTTIDGSKWNTKECVDMDRMFMGCSKLTTLNIVKFNASKVTNMRNMFNGCTSLVSLDLSQWTLGAVDISNMFTGCTALKRLDISSWDSTNVTDMWACFPDNLEYLIINSSTVKFKLRDSPSHDGLSNSNLKVLVPNSAIQTYKNTTNWSSFNNFDAIENYTITRSNGQVTVVKK